MKIRILYHYISFTLLYTYDIHIPHTVSSEKMAGYYH